MNMSRTIAARKGGMKIFFRVKEEAGREGGSQEAEGRSKGARELSCFHFCLLPSDF
jgi:hypothetical protein